MEESLYANIIFLIFLAKIKRSNFIFREQAGHFLHLPESSPQAILCDPNEILLYRFCCYMYNYKYNRFCKLSQMKHFKSRKVR